MRIVVTGGAGFIGSNLVHHLLHRSGQVDPDGCCPDHAFYADLEPTEPVEIVNVDKLTYAADRSHLDGVRDADDYAFRQVDVCDAEAVDDVFSTFEPDAVVHLAAESHVDRSIEAGAAFAETNVLGTQVLLDAARRHDVDRFLHVSTDEVYGSIEEGSFTAEAAYDPSSPYSASKAGSDLLVQAHQTTYDAPVTVTRCTNNYGPRQHPEKLVPKMITLALDDQPLPVYGDGSNVRDWLYVKDHCEALATLLREASYDGDVYNVAGQDERPNIEVVEAILEAVDKPEELVEFVEDRPGHDWRYSLDDARLRGLGWQSQVDFDDGLQLTIEAVADAAESSAEATPS